MTLNHGIGAPAVRPWRHRLAAIVAILGLACAISLTAPALTADAADYPGQADIEAAKAAVSDAESSVGQLDSAIARLETAFNDADVAARFAAEGYTEAQDASITAQRLLYAATMRADEADAALAIAHGNLAGVAMANYRTGGSFGQFEAIVSADGFDDVIVRTEALNRASVEADTTVQEVRAAELVAGTMRTYAEEAAVEAQAAEQRAQEALDVAQQARRDAEQALADVERTRNDAVARLAELQGTSVELERARQEGLATERQQRERAVFEQAQRDAAAQESASGGSASGGGSGSGGSSSGGGSNDGGSSDGGSSDGGAGGSGGSDDSGSGGDSGGSGSGGDSSGGDDDPAPAPPPPPSSTAWKSSAAQGKQAVNHAMTLLGSPYESGGNGPGYDCSGLTSASWAAAGFSIPRSSGTQYAGLPKVPLAQLRPGDLVFWGSNRDPSKMYHVAIYIGNGKIAEATTHGHPAKTRSFPGTWQTGDIMMNAARP
jgi:cell wall-associated NlpC family hydrolase